MVHCTVLLLELDYWITGLQGCIEQWTLKALAELQLVYFLL